MARRKRSARDARAPDLGHVALGQQGLEKADTADADGGAGNPINIERGPRKGDHLIERGTRIGRSEQFEPGLIEFGGPIGALAEDWPQIP